MSRNASPQAAPGDLLTVREAAQAVGVSADAVQAWIRRGRLTAQSGPGVRRVSLAAVQALVTLPAPHTPADAVAIYEALRHTDVSRSIILTWVKQGRLSTWRGRYGTVVRVADVQNLAQQRAMAAAARRNDTLLPADALSVRDVVRLSGVTESRLYMWMKKGLLPAWPVPGSGQHVRLADVMALTQRPGRALPPRPERES